MGKVGRKLYIGPPQRKKGIFTMSSFFLNCVRTTAVFLAAVSIVSCGTESKEPASQLGLRPYYDFQYNLAPLTIGIRLFHPDYGFTPSIDVYEGSIRCDSQDILTQAGMLTLKNNLKIMMVTCFLNNHHVKNILKNL